MKQPTITVTIPVPPIEKGCGDCRFLTKKVHSYGITPRYAGHELISTEESFFEQAHCILFNAPVSGGPCTACINLRKN